MREKRDYFQPVEEKASGPIAIYNHLSRGCRTDETEFSSEVHSERTRGKRQNCNMANSNLIERNFLIISDFNHWKRFFRWQWNVSTHGDIWNVTGQGPEQGAPLSCSGHPFKQTWFGFDYMVLIIYLYIHIQIYIYIYRVSLKRYLTFIVSFSFKYAQILAKHWYYMFKVHSGTHENCILPYFTTCAKILAWTKLVSCYWNQWSWKAENEVRRRWDYCHHTCNKLFWLN